MKKIIISLALIFFTAHAAMPQITTCPTGMDEHYGCRTDRVWIWVPVGIIFVPVFFEVETCFSTCIIPDEDFFN